MKKAKKSVKRRFAGLICFIVGHDHHLTGRHLTMLYQTRCGRCGALFCGHVDEAMFLPWDMGFENLFSERERRHITPSPKRRKK